MTNATNIRTNCMGTISFHAKFTGMNKPQDFIVYPNPEKHLAIQSDNRWGYVKTDGKVIVAKARNSFEFAAVGHRLDQIENIDELLAAVRGTAGKMVGNNGMAVYCDNSTAANVGVK